MIKLRLRRMGAKKRASYRIVVADSRSPRDGRFIEVIGHYDPLTDPATIRVNEERARHWLGHGAQPTDTVRDILRRMGIIADSRAGGVTAGPGSAPVAAESAGADDVPLPEAQATASA